MPCEQGQVNGKAQAKSDMGNSWILRKGGGCGAGIAVGPLPCPGAATVPHGERGGCSGSAERSGMQLPHV